MHSLLTGGDSKAGVAVTSWEEAADVGGLHADGGHAWTALRAWLRHEGSGGHQGGAEA